VINSPIRLSPRILGRPAGAWCRDHLRIAYLSTGHDILVETVHLALEPVTSTTTPIGLSTSCRRPLPPSMNGWPSPSLGPIGR